MKFRVLSVFVLLLALCALSVSGQGSQTLTIFAASSLTDAFEEIALAFEGANPGVDVVYNFGGSSTLATQLADGAPADVFASANNTQMTNAVNAGRIGGTPRTFVKNRLVLIVPVDNPAGIGSLHDVANAGVKLVVAVPGVPVRDYTDAMLEKLAADPAYGEEYRAAVLANIVSEEENVRQVSAKVALGEADAGVVYRSDVTPDIADEVIALPIPDAVNTLATYPIALTDNPANPELAQAFVDYVLGDAGQDTLVKWGFTSIRIPALPLTVSLPTDGTATLDGQVLNPLTLTSDFLRSDFAAHTLDVTYLSGENTVTTSYTGALLWDIIGSAQSNFNADVKNDKISMYLVVTASDGYQAVIAWGEVDPEYANQPILLAYDEQGQPLADGLTLVVPSDQRGSRYVHGVVNISLRDAPTAAS
ncbi:MAG: molybdate ABC transporter substrate-binding protein [Anaerolineae bacterium]|nr:molybdate ABC transporter substrate-binding protein [Anaerolineae bacterium]